jgi:hypothetical protein
MQLFEHNLLFIIASSIVGVIPHKIHICKKSGRRKGSSILAYSASKYAVEHTPFDVAALEVDDEV